MSLEVDDMPNESRWTGLLLYAAFMVVLAVMVTGGLWLNAHGVHLQG